MMGNLRLKDTVTSETSCACGAYIIRIKTRREIRLVRDQSSFGFKVLVRETPLGAIAYIRRNFGPFKWHEEVPDP